MRKLLFALFLGALTSILSGCGAAIFDAKFDQFNGALGSPIGPVPGPPEGDFILAQGDDRFAQIAGNALLLRQPGAGTSTGGYTGRIYLGSARVAHEHTSRTIFFIGRFTGDTAFNTAPLAVDISAQDSSSLEPWPNQQLRLNLSNSDVELLNSSEALLQGPSPLQYNQKHRVFISLFPEEGRYSVTITQPSEQKIEWSGALPNGTANLLMNRRRIVVRLSFPEGVSSAFVSSYTLDEAVMREK
jgi:hypothetical protein